ncbi:unnamed protein product [Ambrosiozyma monospora]|uniref:Unnamed protein product n=1 Tax=Ambrosiozyma monospora TaxID=43982 RepID=A0ACB5U5G6_AMBMO|nr:unnamed protein product [Ambrosiozyma monospora]
MSRRSLSNIHSPVLMATSASTHSIHDTTTADSNYIPPWTSPYVIGVAGFSGSGKTTVAQQIIKQINEPWTVLLSMDNFYKPLTQEQRKKAFNSEYDFDTPEALDLELMFECVRNLKEGKRVEIPVYSFSLHDRTSEKITIYGANVIIIEGIYSLYR